MHLPGFGFSGRTFLNTSSMPRPRPAAAQRRRRLTDFHDADDGEYFTERYAALLNLRLLLAEIENRAIYNLRPFQAQTSRANASSWNSPICASEQTRPTLSSE
jgi:hypothetical protein